MEEKFRQNGYLAELITTFTIIALHAS